MNTFKKFVLALVIVICTTTAFAGYRVQYFVGYGVYPYWAFDPTSTAPGTGLLAVNGSHRTLIQLISAGPNGFDDGLDAFNPGGNYIGGDDVVLDSRILEAGVDGVDEWGYTATPPPPYVSTNSPSFLFVRVHQGADSPEPLSSTHWTYDSPLFLPADIDSSIPLPPADVLATVIHIETGSESVPTSGVTLDRDDFLCMSCPVWTPDPPAAMEIQYVEFDPATTGISFPIPYSYSFNALYGANAVLPGGGWNWQLLEEGTHYTVANGVVTLVTTGSGAAPLQMIRLGLIHNF